ncbi:MAG: glycosyltransferase, partial [Cellulomonas sp.]|nr:glycosyltransferase [Cellulomonas sp.]
MGGVAPPLVIVPAHDEARVIGRCLRALLDDAEPGEVRVVVVSNGSGDGTADVARASVRPGELVEVIEIAQPSKVVALRAGLTRSAGAAVAVVDADVVVPTGTVRALARALAEPGAMVAGARPVVDTTRATWPVRRYYRVWKAMPYGRGAVIGSGVFALTAAAVDEIGTFPDVVNDDGWVRRRFAPEQRRLVDEPFTVLAARTVRALTARRARVING